MSEINKVRLSKYLSKILRHQAINLGLKIDNQGFIKINDLIQHLKKTKNFKMIVLNDIKEVVINDNKNRYSIKLIDKIEYIRANQGHSMKSVKIELLEIKSHLEIPICIHGTYSKNINNIKKLGLSKMNRNHIHMASGLPENGQIISGMRKSCDTIIWIDVEKAMLNGIKFYKSENDVILSPGNSEGIIPFTFIKKITNRLV